MTIKDVGSRAARDDKKEEMIVVAQGVGGFKSKAAGTSAVHDVFKEVEKFVADKRESVGKTLYSQVLPF